VNQSLHPRTDHGGCPPELTAAPSGARKQACAGIILYVRPKLLNSHSPRLRASWVRVSLSLALSAHPAVLLQLVVYKEQQVTWLNSQPMRWPQQRSGWQGKA
jgi:hypothetical protein